MHITNDYDTVVHSVLNGITNVESQPDRLVSKQLELLAMSLQGQVQEAEEPRIGCRVSWHPGFRVENGWERSGAYGFLGEKDSVYYRK